MQTKIEFTGESIKILNIFRGLRKNIPETVREELDVIGQDIRSNIMTGMRDTVRQAIRRGKRGHQPSAPGNPPAIDGGRLVNSFEIKTSKYKLEVGTNVIYGKFLDKGTKFIKPRPIFAPAIADMKIHERIADAYGKAFT